MNTVNKTVLVTHTAAQMFDLVDNVVQYPQFLPWCGKTEVHMRDETSLEATLYMDYMKIKQSFSTRNDNIPNQRIHMQLLNGPFKSLDGVWQFTPLGDIGCKVEFNLQYEFSSSILSALIGPVFGKISSTLVDAFIKEADKRYG